MLDIIKNPVIIGLTVGVLVHLYFKWEASKKENKDKNKRKDSNLLIPLFLGIATWFIAHNYYEKYNFDEVISDNINNINNINYQIPEKLDLSEVAEVSNVLMINPDANLVNNFNSKFTMRQPSFNNMQQQPSFHLLKKGVTIPNNITLPDVLLEKF
jgi:hypothetical protein